MYSNKLLATAQTVILKPLNIELNIAIVKQVYLFVRHLRVEIEAWSASDFRFQETRILTPDQARGFKMTF